MMLGLFPVNAKTCETARDIGSLLYKIDRKHRKRAMENLRASFPDMPQAELESIAERSMQHFISLVMDVLFTTRMINVESWHRYVHLKGLAESLKIFLRGRGAIVLTGHYGNAGEHPGLYPWPRWVLKHIPSPAPSTIRISTPGPLGVRETRRGQIILSSRSAVTNHRP